MVLHRPIECTSIKGEVKKKNTASLAGIFLALQPTGWSKSCSDRPHQVLD
jgi:hypothetical protein